MIHEIARAYHCPQGVMAHLAHRHRDLFETIKELGPMRIYWCSEWGWMLNGTPVHFRRDPATGNMGFYPTVTNVRGLHLKRAWRAT